MVAISGHGSGVDFNLVCGFKKDDLSGHEAATAEVGYINKVHDQLAVGSSSFVEILDDATVVGRQIFPRKSNEVVGRVGVGQKLTITTAVIEIIFKSDEAVGGNIEVRVINAIKTERETNRQQTAHFIIVQKDIERANNACPGSVNGCKNTTGADGVGCIRTALRKRI